MRWTRWASLVGLVAALVATPASAQVQGPVYVVQAGDNLTAIAATFGVALSELMSVNGIGTGHILHPGDQLIIPGLEGITGTLSTREVELGEDLATLALRYGLSAEAILRLNHVVNPERIYAGQELVITEPGAPQAYHSEKGQTVVLDVATPLILAAAGGGVSPWELLEVNRLPSGAAQFSGQTLLVPGGDQPLRAWASPIADVVVRSLPLVQGRTAAFHLRLQEDAVPAGHLKDSELHFAQEGSSWVALQGVNAMADPGTYPFEVHLTTAGGKQVSFAQDLLMVSGGYKSDAPLTVDPEYVDPETNGKELETMAAIVSPFEPTRAWSGSFSPPAAGGITSPFGRRRVFNGSYKTYHGGIDFAAQVGTPIRAPAPGRVVFVGSMVICGNTTVIDHGWGVYTRYCHQSIVQVRVGDQVVAGQQIGAAGRTGRATGPHLHWEVWVNGVQVDPDQWVKEIFP